MMRSRLTSLILVAVFALVCIPKALANESTDGISAAYACHLGICDGDAVTVTTGQYEGLTGNAQFINPQSGYFNLVNAEDGTFLMHTTVVRRGFFPPSCLYGFCVGNRTIVKAGPFAGLVTWVNGFRPGRQMVRTRDSLGRLYLFFPTNLQPY